MISQIAPRPRASRPSTTRRGGTTITGNGPTPGIAQALAVTLTIVTVIVSVGWWITEIIAAFKLRAGRRWARVLLTVLGAITLAVNLARLGGTGLSLATDPTGPQAATVVDGILLVAQSVVVVAALILMWQATTSAYLHSAALPHGAGHAEAVPDPSAEPDPAHRPDAAHPQP